MRWGYEIEKPHGKALPNDLTKSVDPKLCRTLKI